MGLKSSVIVCYGVLAHVIVSTYGVEASCNRVLLWGWISQEFCITLKSCIIFVSSCGNETAIHMPPHNCDAVAVCPTKAHGPAGTWNAGRHISDVLAFQQQTSWRVWCGLAWVLSVSHRDVTCFTQSECNTSEAVSVHLDAVRRHSLSAVRSVLHSSSLLAEVYVCVFCIVIPLCLSVDVFVARVNRTFEKAIHSYNKTN